MGNNRWNQDDERLRRGRREQRIRTRRGLPDRRTEQVEWSTKLEKEEENDENKRGGRGHGVKRELRRTQTQNSRS